MMATVGLDASDLTAFRDMNSTDFNMTAEGMLASPYFALFEGLFISARVSEYSQIFANQRGPISTSCS